MQLEVGKRVRLKYIGIEVVITEIRSVDSASLCGCEDHANIVGLEDDDGRPRAVREWFFDLDDIDDDPELS